MPMKRSVTPTPNNAAMRVGLCILEVGGHVRAGYRGAQRSGKLHGLSLFADTAAEVEKLAFEHPGQSAEQSYARRKLSQQDPTLTTPKNLAKALKVTGGDLVD